LSVIIGAVLVVLYVLYVLGSKLVDRHFKKTDELEARKETYLTKSIEEVKISNRAHALRIETIQEHIVEAKTEIVSAKNNINRNIDALSRLQETLNDFVRDTNKRLSAIEKGRWIQAGPQTWILKND